MHGALCERMAEVVENSRFVLMCMSETYKSSSNCKSEATYSPTEGKTIIPVKLTSGVKLNVSVERDNLAVFERID
jgi:hypothetical protein